MKTRDPTPLTDPRSAFIEASLWHGTLEREPQLVSEVQAEGGKLLAEFAGNGNTDGVRRLFDLGVQVGALFQEGDGYWGIAKNSSALHVAAWRARHTTVKLLIERGVPGNVPDGAGRRHLFDAARMGGQIRQDGHGRVSPEPRRKAEFARRSTLGHAAGLGDPARIQPYRGTVKATRCDVMSDGTNNKDSTAKCGSQDGRPLSRGSSQNSSGGCHVD